MHSWLDTILEAYIAYILTREYYWGRSDTDLKREEKRRQAKKSKVEQPVLREGTGGVLQETKREMCNLPEAPESVQTSTESGPQP